VGDVYQVRKNDVLINHNRTELILPKNEQIAKERYRKGDVIRAVIKEVVRKGSGMPMVIVSRADKLFLQKLFELEIPEVYDGVISLRKIAREPGERAKVAVESHDDRIDAVGACVGMKGVRIHTIVRELNNENIDVINYTDVPELFIARALAPAKLKGVEVNKDDRTANVLVASDQVSLAIGRNGQNIRLASKLTEYEINLIKEGGDEDDYDIELVDFKPELGAELYDKLINAGLETAKDVLNATMDSLLAIEGLDEAKVKEIRDMIRRDLEEAEVEDDEEQVEPGKPIATATPDDVPPGGVSAPRPAPAAGATDQTQPAPGDGGKNS